MVKFTSNASITSAKNLDPSNKTSLKKTYFKMYYILASNRTSSHYGPFLWEHEDLPL